MLERRQRPEGRPVVTGENGVKLDAFAQQGFDGSASAALVKIARFDQARVEFQVVVGQRQPVAILAPARIFVAFRAAQEGDPPGAVDFDQVIDQAARPVFIFDLDRGDS